MEVIILDRNDFKYKDHAYVSEFEINLDMVITQRSTFKVNKQKLYASIGDFVYVKDSETYFGIIENIEDEKTHLFLSCVDFKELFRVEVLLKSFNGHLADYIESLISQYYLTNQDNVQNMTYLKVSKETSRTGSLTFEEDKVGTIYEVLELVNKMYGVYLKYEVIFEYGSFKGIVIRIVNVLSGVKIKADGLSLEDLVVNDSSKESLNKAVYYPKKSNLFYKSTITYYLLSDGEISKDINNPMRIRKVVSKTQTYADNDYLELESKAKSLLQISKTDHQISFTTSRIKNSLDVLKNLYVGDFVQFMYKDKVYDSVVSAMSFKNSFEVVRITLGEYRVKLTEKLQILSKNMNSQMGNITVANSGVSDLDGGEY